MSRNSMRRRAGVALAVWATVLAVMGWPDRALAQKRIALVIGNASYQHSSKLDNTRNDALDMSAALKKLGFTVIEGPDLDKSAMERKLREFARALAGSDVGLLFYAGHGLQVGGQNYLVPIDAKLEDASSLDFELVRLDLVQRTMERETRTNILFLDACRDNPLARNLARAMGTRSTAIIGRGLAPVEAGGGTLISYSTQPGNVALDGTGRNSPFAGALVKHIVAPGVDVGALLIRVRREVMQETQNRQVPWEHSALTDPFYFSQAAEQKSPVSTVAPQLRLSELAEVWDRTKDTTNIPVLEAFIARYKDTFYAELARTRIEDLKKQVATAVPPSSGGPIQPEAPKSTAKPPEATQIALWRDAAKPATFKMQSMFPVDWSKAFPEKLASLSGAKLSVEPVAPGSIVSLADQLDGVSRGALLLALGSPSYWAEKSAALHVFGGQVSLGLDIEQFARWMRDRGEAELNGLYQNRLKLEISIARLRDCGT